jgi:GAF domain-containing protein
VDADRQWFKARIGLSTSETSRDAAFCARTILGRELMVITDTHQDARFRDNPLVTGAPYIRFYAGAPLRTADELALGSLCVIDYVPRVLSPEQRLALKSLGRLVVLQLDARRQAIYAREPHTNGTPHG